MRKFNQWVNRKETGINSELFWKYFKFQRPADMSKAVYTANDRNENNNLVNMINSGLRDLKNEIEDMNNEIEIEIEEPDKRVDIVKKILEFNDQNQKGQGLKMLPPDQMLTKLPITLAQLKAGNNSKKLENEIRQLMYSLYRSKKVTRKKSIKILSTLFKSLLTPKIAKLINLIDLDYH